MDNKVETKNKAEIMIAYVEGKDIEAKDIDYPENAWGVCAYPAWNWSKNQYRVRKVENENNRA